MWLKRRQKGYLTLLQKKILKIPITYKDIANVTEKDIENANLNFKDIAIVTEKDVKKVPHLKRHRKIPIA